MAPPVMADLVPLHKMNEVLLDVCKERPTLFVFGNNPIILGRNRTTQISMINISRQLCRIQHNGHSLTLVSLKETNALQINSIPLASQGTIVTLNDNDIISLLDNDYQYQVVLKHYEQNEPLNTTTAATITATNNTVVKEGPLMEELDQHGLDDEFICAVCLNIIVKATACHPCGHIFCHDCIHMASFCHMCRTNMIVMPMKHVDNVIWKLVKMGGIFPMDDIKPYLERNTDIHLTEIEVIKIKINSCKLMQCSTLIRSYCILVMHVPCQTLTLSPCLFRKFNFWVHNKKSHES